MPASPRYAPSPASHSQTHKTVNSTPDRPSSTSSMIRCEARAQITASMPRFSRVKPVSASLHHSHRAVQEKIGTACTPSGLCPLAMTTHVVTAPTAIPSKPNSKRTFRAWTVNRTKCAANRFTANSVPIVAPPGNQNAPWRTTSPASSRNSSAVTTSTAREPQSLLRDIAPRAARASPPTKNPIPTIVRMACSGSCGNHEAGNSTVTSTHASQARKYSEITSHISIVTWARVPMKISRMASANRTTDSLREAHGRSRKRTAFSKALRSVE